MITTSPIFDKNVDDRLRAMIKKSKDIPKKEKKHILINLSRTEESVTKFLGNGEKYKNLLATAMFLRSYDIYTSSLLAFLFRDRISINILLRAQLENMFIVAYYIKNKNEIKNAFLQKIKPSKARSYLAEWFADIGLPEINQELLKGVYDSTSEIVHPFPEGIKFYFEPLHIMTRDESPVPVSKPALAVARHHGRLDDKDTVLSAINQDFVHLYMMLLRLAKLDADDEIKDYSEIHKKTTPPDQEKRD